MDLTELMLYTFKQKWPSESVQQDMIFSQILTSLLQCCHEFRRHCMIRLPLTMSDTSISANIHQLYIRVNRCNNCNAKQLSAQVMHESILQAWHLQSSQKWQPWITLLSKAEVHIPFSSHCCKPLRSLSLDAFPRNTSWPQCVVWQGKFLYPYNATSTPYGLLWWPQHWTSCLCQLVCC